MNDKAPFLFISHKHVDRHIAKVIAEFIEERSVGKIKIHLSSSPDFQGPRFGPSLNAQLREALWNTEVLILLYTSEEQDWSYCMWECGMAMHPQSPNTNLVVFQCGRDVPSPFKDVLRVDPRSRDDVKSFTKQLLREAAFFKGGAILPELKDTYIENLATDLHSRLKEVLPQLDDGQVEQWPAWPHLRLELPRTEADKVAQASGGERRNLSRRIISDHAEVVQFDARAAQLFGKLSLPAKVKLFDLFNAWKEKYHDGDMGWFDSCCDQIAECARRGFPVISSTAMREIDGDASFTPIVTRVHRQPFGGTVQFDIYFFNLSDPRSILVTSRMTPISNIFYKRVGDVELGAIHLKNLIEELVARKRNRVPILNSNGAPLYIVHRSMIDQFITRSILEHGDPKLIHQFTLSDLLADPDMKSMFENSFCVVSEKSTLAEAKEAMTAREGCSDVFITKTRISEEPVTGLLTNVKITRNI
jgi:hypothetical protein